MPSCPPSSRAPRTTTGEVLCSSFHAALQCSLPGHVTMLLCLHGCCTAVELSMCAGMPARVPAVIESLPMHCRVGDGVTFSSIYNFTTVNAPGAACGPTQPP